MNVETLPGPEWLPGLPADFDAENRIDGLTAAGATFWVPQLDEDEAVAVADHVRAAALAARTTHRVADVVVAVGAAARRLSDPEDEVGRAAIRALQQSAAYTRDAALEVLRENAAGWTGPRLGALVRSELGELAVLDEPRPDPDLPGRRRRAAGPSLLHIVLAGNVPGVALTAVIRGLIVRSGVLCKLAKNEPWLVGLFARALHEEDPALAATIAATWWPVDVPGPVAHEWTKRSGKVIVYGGAEAVRSIRARTPPTIPVLEYGPRIGATILGPATTDAELRGLARDTCAYDQAGCVSPRLVYMLSDPEASAGTAEHDALDRLCDALSAEVAARGRPFLTDSEAMDIRGIRARLQLGGPPGTRVEGPDDLGWTIVYRPAIGSFSEPLPRVLYAYRAESTEELARLRPVLEGRLQALAVAGVSAATRRRLEDLAVEMGVSRVTRPGAMAWPPSDWRHDGRMQLLPLLRWTDFEDESGIDDDRAAGG